MPRTKIGDKYGKPKVPPPNYLSELLKRYKKAQGLSDEDLAAKLGACRKTVNVRLNQKPEAWNIGELESYCEVLKIPFIDALTAAGTKK